MSSESDEDFGFPLERYYTAVTSFCDFEFLSPSTETKVWLPISSTNSITVYTHPNHQTPFLIPCLAKYDPHHY